jgi:hypothetical protein
MAAILRSILAEAIDPLITSAAHFTDSSCDFPRPVATIERLKRKAFDLGRGASPMQATRDADGTPQSSPILDAKASRLQEYVYRAAILAAVILLLWTVA